MELLRKFILSSLIAIVAPGSVRRRRAERLRRHPPALARCPPMGGQLLPLIRLDPRRRPHPQVTVALLVAYAYVLLFARTAPYAHKRTNAIGYLAQIDLFLLLLVALLLKVRLFL